MSTPPTDELLRHSAQLVRQGIELRRRMSVSIHMSNMIIDRSRKLLSDWPVVAVPTLQILDARPSATPELPEESAASPMQALAVETELVRVVEQNFTAETVCLDNRHFIDCVVENCVLEYNGGSVVLEGTNFKGCRFHFGGDAVRTVALLGCFGMIEDSGLCGVSPSSSSVSANRVN